MAHTGVRLTYLGNLYLVDRGTLTKERINSLALPVSVRNCQKKRKTVKGNGLCRLVAGGLSSRKGSQA